jgi:hypothetical protein
MPKLDSLSNVLLTMFDLLLDALRFIKACLRARCAQAAENLFLREQLALYLARKVKPRQAKPATKLTLVLLSRLWAWREALQLQGGPSPEGGTEGSTYGNKRPEQMRANQRRRTAIHGFQCEQGFW